MRNFFCFSLSLSVYVVPHYHLLALLDIDAQRLLHQHMMTARVTQHVQQDVDMSHVGSGNDDDVTHARVQQSLVVSKYLKDGGGAGGGEGGMADSHARRVDAPLGLVGGPLGF